MNIKMPSMSGTKLATIVSSNFPTIFSMSRERLAIICRNPNVQILNMMMSLMSGKKLATIR